MGVCRVVRCRSLDTHDMRAAEANDLGKPINGNADVILYGGKWRFTTGVGTTDIFKRPMDHLLTVDILNAIYDLVGLERCQHAWLTCRL